MAKELFMMQEKAAGRSGMTVALYALLNSM
jgi:hypothetical protein